MSSEQELRATSDSFLARVSRLRELESVKRSLTPGTPQMVSVTREVEALASEVLRWAERQTELADKAAQLQPAELRPIAIVPPRDIPTILSEWRLAEQALDAETPGTAAWESVRADVERLRDEYSRAFASRSGDGDARGR